MNELTEDELLDEVGVYLLRTDVQHIDFVKLNAIRIIIKNQNKQRDILYTVIGIPIGLLIGFGIGELFRLVVI